MQATLSRRRIVRRIVRCIVRYIVARNTLATTETLDTRLHPGDIQTSVSNDRNNRSRRAS
jgi:hypothetical protein